MRLIHPGILENTLYALTILNLYIYFGCNTFLLMKVQLRSPNGRCPTPQTPPPIGCSHGASELDPAHLGPDAHHGNGTVEGQVKPTASDGRQGLFRLRMLPEPLPSHGYGHRPPPARRNLPSMHRGPDVVISGYRTRYQFVPPPKTKAENRRPGALPGFSRR